LPRSCGDGSGLGMDDTESREVAGFEDGPRGVTPPPAPPTRGGGSLAKWRQNGSWRPVSLGGLASRLETHGTRTRAFLILRRIGQSRSARPFRYDVLSKNPAG
jgi:hypothetical protein